MSKKFIISIKILIYLSFIIIFFNLFYIYNMNKLEYSIQQLKKSFVSSINILGNGISSGYFRWDDMRNSVIYDDNEILDYIFNEAKYVFQPYLKSIELVNESLTEEFFMPYYKENNFFIYFSIFDSFDDNRLENYSIKAVIDYKTLVSKLSDEERIILGNEGNNFIYNLKYKLNPPVINFQGIIILILGMTLITFIINFLENKNNKIISLNNKLEKLFQISLLLSLKQNKNLEDFLKEFFRMIFPFIPEADYGSLLLFKNEKWSFLDSLGHDISILKDLSLSDQDMLKVDTVKVIKKIQKSTEEHLSIQALNDFEKAVKKVKETLVIPLKTDKKFYGTLSLDIDEKSKKSFSEESIELMKAFSNLVTSYFVLNEYNEIDKEFQNNLILSIIHILEIHDTYTKGHSENVANISKVIAENLGYNEKEIQEVYWAGLVHDIGKIVISYEILNKPGTLNENEYKIIKSHPVHGHDVLSNTKNLKNIADIVLYHHERFDGNGYPEGLKEEEIPVFSRIISVADAYDAMTSNRSYKDPISKEMATKEINKNSGTQFDPKIVEVFNKCFNENKV